MIQGDQLHYQYPKLRFRKTLEFLKSSLPDSETILDIGTDNPLSKLMRDHGYNVLNTEGEDLDIEYSRVPEYGPTAFTAFEIFEHLVAPFNLLKSIPQGKLVSSVPLKVWFANAYWNQQEEWDRHYHEFEPRQYDWLLKKAGWTVVKSELWTSPDKIRLGVRPILRYFVPSYYFVYAVKHAVAEIPTAIMQADRVS